MKGFMVERSVEGTIERCSKPKVAVYSAPLDPSTLETKGTVLIKNAEELLSYTKTEEKAAENFIQSIADAGVNVLVVRNKIPDIVMHYIEKNKIMAVKISSKFETERICKALKCIPIARFGAPNPDEIGYCDNVTVEEIGSQKVTIFHKETEFCKLSTIVLRGSHLNLLDDIERAIDDAVNTFRSTIKDGRYVYGAGNLEISLAAKLASEAKKIESLDQYAYASYA